MGAGAVPCHPVSRRISIELTSARSDGSWTWRASGAREPRGVLEPSLVPHGASVSDVLVAEVETDLDGTRVLSVAPPKSRTERTGLLEILPSERPFEAVTSQLARGRGKGRDGAKGTRRSSAERAGRDRPRRADADRGEGSPKRPARPRFTAPPELPKRPKPRRLKPGRVHVEEVLAELPEAHRPIAERVLAGGVRAVREAVEEQNAQLVAAGAEKIPADGLVSLAVQMKSRLFVAEWLDGAEAAVKILGDIDLRDLRALVAKASDPLLAHADNTTALASQLKEALVRRQDEDTRAWLEDIDAAIGVGRVVRALKMSAQPPKVGQLFPAEVAQRLSGAASAALAGESAPERWVAILEAAAFSPVRTAVLPPGPPASVSEELTRTVTRLAPAMPQVAALFGISVAPGTAMPRPLRPARPQRKEPKTRDRADQTVEA